MHGHLAQLAVRHGSDKWNHHWYAEHYDRAFRHLKDAPVKMLEIGVGGYEFPNRGGNGLRMWAEYFCNKGVVYGLDLHNKSGVTVPANAIIMQGSQSDENVLKHLMEVSGGFDIVVDDGSHNVADQIFSFEYLFPKLPPRAIYCIEDVHSSYWEDKGGRKMVGGRTGKPWTTIEYFLHRVHMMHNQTNGMTKDDFSDTIEGISFFNSLIIIQKGENRNETIPG